MTPLLHHSNPLQYDLSRQLQACQSKARRNGKVARLPAELRDQINRLLDDGVPYKIIIEKLGDAGKHLNEDNISNWRLGGYQDCLKSQAINDRARYQTEGAADVLRDRGHVDPAQIQRACQEIALLQYMDTLMEHGEQIAQESLKKNPAKMITLINACCKSANIGLAIEKQKLRLLPGPSNQPSTLTPSTPNSSERGPE